MAKLHIKIGNAIFDAEGDEQAISASLRQFQRALAENALRDVEQQLQPLLEQRKNVKKLLAKLDAEPLPNQRPS